MDASIAAFRARLPFLKDGLALNHAGISPQPLSERVADFERRRAERLPSRALEETDATARSVRTRYADLLNVRPEEIAITRHTAEGVNIVAQGFPWREGDRILTASVEYPSNVYPWWNLRDRGVVIDAVPERDGRVDYDELDAAIRPETKMMALSHVEFASGFTFDIAQLVEICRPRGIFLFLDIAQSIGAIPVDLSSVDAAAWPTWKWLMGPLGMGGFYLSQKHLNTIRPTQVGSDGMVGRADYLDYNFEFRSDATRFEYSTSNPIGIIGTDDALADFHPTRFERIAAVCDSIVERLGWPIYGTRGSGILSFVTPGNPAEICARLKSKKIEAAVRGGRLRISPHFYNTEEDIDRLISALQ